VVRAEVVEAVGSRRAVGACVGVVDTCSGLSQVGGQTFEAASLVELGAKAGAVGTSAFEAGVAAEGPRVHCCPRSLAAYAGEPLDLRSCLIAAPGKAHRHTAGGRPTALALAQDA